jgi:hypothetical protein
MFLSEVHSSRIIGNCQWILNDALPTPINHLDCAVALVSLLCGTGTPLLYLWWHADIGPVKTLDGKCINTVNSW